MNHVGLEKFERAQLRPEPPDFRSGDTIRVNFVVREGDRERIQAFEGVCIRRSGGGHAETITVRKISSGIGVERTFFLHSPLVEGIQVVRKGHVRRARLYYLRERFGKKARVKSSKKFFSLKQEKSVDQPVEEEAVAEELTETPGEVDDSSEVAEELTETPGEMDDSSEEAAVDVAVDAAPEENEATKEE